MAKISNWEKFKLLLWKNFSLQWNHKMQLIVEIFLPILFSLLLILIRSLVTVTYHDAVQYIPQNITDFELLKQHYEKTRPLPQFAVYYSPQNPYLESIIKDVASTLELKSYVSYVNASSLQKALMESMETIRPVLAGIEFDDSMASLTSYPKEFKYSLRFPSSLRTNIKGMQFTWFTMYLFEPIDFTGPRNAGEADGGVPVGYLREGFTTLQHAISMAYIRLAGNVTTPLPDVHMQRYPYPAYKFDPILQGLASMFSLIILLSFIYPSTTLTKSITIEKERQLKEVMKIMGLQNWIHWAAWFLKAFVMLGISAILITTLIKINWMDGVSVLTYSSWSAILFFMLIYVINAICFCFMMSVFFSRASTAAAVTGLIWFITYIPFSFTNMSTQVTTLASKLGYSLFLNSALGYGGNLILGFEGTGEGVQWGNLFKTYSVDEPCSLAAIMGMMLLSSAIYMMICFYVEQIFPGDYGVPKKWYFLFTKSFWCKQEPNCSDNDGKLSNGVIRHRNPEAFEPAPSGKNIGLQVRNLKKNFGDKTAVNGLSVNMYENEITVLLGHNGAGKTTTISMLTGMFPPTSGTATVNGYDIRTNTEEARASMGICPQHNVLFDDMTVANHIVFYSRLKGLHDDEIAKEVDKYLKMIELENKANALASTLSGGMKRKLSVCCALCGGTRVVLCDEPSSGMDPSARRQLWDLLQAEKVGRTILLTTHFMDEADVLGDRIAIMCGGDLRCHGTSFFLKKKYGSGYRLICVKEEDCNSSNITTLLQKYIPGIKPESEIGAELAFLLPDDFSSVFEEMFRSLEDQSHELGLSGYGISITSMEEVFLKVGAEDTNQNDIKHPELDGSINILNKIEDIEASSENDFSFSDTTHLLRGSSLALNQWKAMFQKKILYTYRNKLLFFIQNVMPILFVCMTILISRRQGLFQVLKPLKIDITQYPETVTILEAKSDIVMGSFEESIAVQYEALAKSYGRSHAFESTGVENFEDYILKTGNETQVWVNLRYLVSATIGNGTITAWLNNQPYHTAPLTLNMIHNAMAKVLVDPNAEISVTNAPLPYVTKDILAQVTNGNSLGTQLAMNVSFCMAFVTSFYAIFVIKERESRSKLLQFVGGVNVWTYWITQFLWDLLTFLFTAFITISTVACFQEDTFSTFTELSQYFLLFIIFGIGMLPYAYIISSTSTEPASGFAKLSIINIFGGMALFITVIVLSLDLLDTKHIANILSWICRLFPHFSLAWGMNKLHANIATRNVCSLIDERIRCVLQPTCCEIPAYYASTDPGILWEVIYLLGLGLVLFLVIILKEYQLMSDLAYKAKTKILKPPLPPVEKEMDDDVLREKERVANMSLAELQTQNLVLNRVTKFYGKFLAVNQISLGVKHMDCFGLLGVNGAGKTTTFKMMTGDERINSGTAYVRGMNLQKEINEIYHDIGYCPQFDALLDDLTGRELLRMFCLLRGIRIEHINALSEELAKCFGFTKHLDKPTSAYSGGNKRKLSTAISVIGSPSVIYLDEPTTGMDPASRRQLWNMVCRIRDSGKSIVLTSHSMEECEALCTRLAIMVNGEFKCIGSTQHLKNKFSKGLVLKIKTEHTVDVQNKSVDVHQFRQNRIDLVKQFITKEFAESVLQEEYLGILTFYIPLTAIKWSRAFGAIERNRSALHIEDYSISQTTLEEIFLDFAKHQYEDKRLFK